MRFSRSTHLLMFLYLETLMSIIRTGLPVLVELINLVSSVITFVSQMTLLRWLTFLLGSQTCDCHSPALLDFFLSSDTSICSTMTFPPVGNSYHVVVSVSMDFPTNSQRDAPFHCIAYDYSRAGWDDLHDHLRDDPWEDIFKLLVNFVSGFRLKLMYISLIENVRSSLIHLRDFQLLVLLP